MGHVGEEGGGSRDLRNGTSAKGKGESARSYSLVVRVLQTNIIELIYHRVGHIVCEVKRKKKGESNFRSTQISSSYFIAR